MKPYAESCDQNRDPILAVIQPWLTDKKTVLEIGSGTGQHAIYFSEKMPHLNWQTSDCRENHAGIQQWLDDTKLTNTLPPIALDVSQDTWPDTQYDVIFSANAVHIMAWRNVVDFFTQAPIALKSDGLLILYGPFNYKGNYTSDSNARFDQWLKQRNPDSGIRDFEALDAMAQQGGLHLLHDKAMPANNRTLCWKKPV